MLTSAACLKHPLLLVPCAQELYARSSRGQHVQKNRMAMLLLCTVTYVQCEPLKQKPQAQF